MTGGKLKSALLIKTFVPTLVLCLLFPAECAGEADGGNFSPLTEWPKITGITPGRPYAEPSRQWISIHGAGFVPGSDVILMIKESSYLIPEERTAFQSSDKIKVYAGLTVEGEWKARVENPDNLTSNSYSFTVAPIYGDLPEWLFREAHNDPAARVRMTAGWKQWGRVWEDGGLAGGLHTGIDYAALRGTPVYSVADGEVIRVVHGGYCDTCIAGGSVRCRSSRCLSLVSIYNEATDVTFHYLHGKNIQVEFGDWIKSGDKIFEVCSLGYSTGPHLHFGARSGRRPLAALDAARTVNPYKAARTARAADESLSP